MAGRAASGPPAGREARLVAREIDRSVAGRLRRRRIQLGITQQGLAAAVGLSYQQVQKYETAVNRISAGRLLCLARALGVGPAYFFAGVEETDRLEDKAISILRGEGSAPLEPALRRTILLLLGSLGQGPGG